MPLPVIDASDNVSVASDDREQLALWPSLVGSRHKRSPGDMSKIPRTGSKRLTVLRAIAEAGRRGITSEELGMRLLLSPADIDKARLELIDGRWVEHANVTRRTSLGKDEIIWRLTPDGTHRWEESGIK